MNQRYKLNFQKNCFDEKTISQRVHLKTDSISCQDARLKKTKIKYFLSRVDFRSQLYSCKKYEIMKIYAKSDISKLRLGAQSVTLLSTLRDPTQLRQRQCSARV